MIAPSVRMGPRGVAGSPFLKAVGQGVAGAKVRGAYPMPTPCSSLGMDANA